MKYFGKVISICLVTSMILSGCSNLKKSDQPVEQSTEETQQEATDMYTLQVIDGKTFYVGDTINATDLVQLAEDESLNVSEYYNVMFVLDDGTMANSLDATEAGDFTAHMVAQSLTTGSTGEPEVNYTVKEPDNTESTFDNTDAEMSEQVEDTRDNYEYDMQIPTDVVDGMWDGSYGNVRVLPDGRYAIMAANNGTFEGYDFSFEQPETAYTNSEVDYDYAIYATDGTSYEITKYTNDFVYTDSNGTEQTLAYPVFYSIAIGDTTLYINISKDRTFDSVFLAESSSEELSTEESSEEVPSEETSTEETSEDNSISEETSTEEQASKYNISLLAPLSLFSSMDTNQINAILDLVSLDDSIKDSFVNVLIDPETLQKNMFLSTATEKQQTESVSDALTSITDAASDLISDLTDSGNGSTTSSKSGSTKVSGDYYTEHKELYTWPGTSEKYERWDYQFHPDSTTFVGTMESDGKVFDGATSTVTDKDGNVIAGGNGVSSSSSIDETESESETEEKVVELKDTDYPRLILPQIKLKVDFTRAGGFNYNKSESTASKIIITNDDNKFIIATTTTQSIARFRQQCLYNITKRFKDSFRVDEGDITTGTMGNITNYVIVFTDKDTGEEVRAPYMSVYNINDDLVFCYSEKLLDPNSTTLQDILNECLEEG